MSKPSRVTPDLGTFDLRPPCLWPGGGAFSSLLRLLSMSDLPDVQKLRREWGKIVESHHQQLVRLIREESQRPSSVRDDARGRDTDGEDVTLRILRETKQICQKGVKALERLAKSKRHPEKRQLVLEKGIVRLIRLHHYIGEHPATDFLDVSAGSELWKYALSGTSLKPSIGVIAEMRNICNEVCAAAKGAPASLPVENLALLHLVSNMLLYYCLGVEYDEDEAQRASRAADEIASRWGYQRS